MAKLIFLNSEIAGRALDLNAEKITVGRASQNALVIRDRSISQTHCEILVFGLEVIIRDLNSANGTFINGVRIRKSQVKHGQVIRFGLVEARLQFDLPKESDPVTFTDPVSSITVMKTPTSNPC